VKKQGVMRVYYMDQKSGIFPRNKQRAKLTHHLGNVRAIKRFT